MFETVIQEWLAALETERIYQQEQYRTILEQTSIRQRVSEGYTWYPLRVKETGFGLGNLPYIVAERDVVAQAQEDQFQAGRPVQLFTTSDATMRPVRGIVHWVQRQQIKVFLQTEEHPDELSRGKWGLDVLYDEQTFKEMKDSFKRVLQLPHNHRSVSVRDIFYGQSRPTYAKDPATGETALLPPDLNPAQQAAVSRALSSCDVHVIHGPPGTGKTTTLKALIQCLLRTEAQILFCAPSNSAVDWMAGLLHASGVRVLRVGHLSRIDPEIIECGLESQVQKEPEGREIRKIKKQADECRRMANQYKRTFDTAARERRKELYREARELSDWASALENRAIDSVVSRAQVIACTFSGAAGSLVQQRTFRTCIIDEASQALQGACWIPMLLSARVILAGDPFQLPPTVKSPEAMKKGLGKTLLDLALERFGDELSLLDIQYRMHEEIMAFSNQWFYGGKLRAHSSAAARGLMPASQGPALEFIDTAGCGFSEERQQDAGSYFNPNEYTLIMEHIVPLMHEAFVQAPDWGILSPYSAQVKYIRRAVEEESSLIFPVTVRTIDGFQGQERDVIYISLVRSNEQGDIGFLKDYRRMNVAMTRARRKLVIIGDSATLGGDPFYDALLAYVDSNGSYRSAWEFMR